MNAIVRRTVLFVAVSILVTADAFAFYNPAAGRWLSRDPIEERGGSGLYTLAVNATINAIDSRGQIAINTTQDRQYPATTCGAMAAEYTFRLDSPAPCEGYIFQHVSFSRTWTDCRSPNQRAQRNGAEYWEVWPYMIKAGAMTSDDPNAAFLDTFDVAGVPNSNGYQEEKGFMFFVCKKDLAEDPTKWPTGIIHLQIDFNTGVLPHSLTPPKETPDSTATGEVGEHNLSAAWNCCCNPRWSHSEASTGPASKL